MAQCATGNFGHVNRIAIVTLGILTSMFSIIALYTCTFIANTDKSIYYDYSEGFGLFSFEVDGQCRNYEDNKTEGIHTVAQGFGIAASASIGAAVMSSIVAFRKPFAFRWSAIFFAFALMCSMLTMLMFAAPYKHRVCLERGDCRPGFGAGLNIANILLLPGLVLLSHMKTNESEHEENGSATSQDKTEVAEDPQHVRKSDDGDAEDQCSLFSGFSSVTSEPRRQRQKVFRGDDETVNESSWNGCACFP